MRLLEDGVNQGWSLSEARHRVEDLLGNRGANYALNSGQPQSDLRIFLRHILIVSRCWLAMVEVLKR